MIITDPQKELDIRRKIEAEYKARFFDYIVKGINNGLINPNVRIGVANLFSQFEAYEKINFKAKQGGKRKKLNLK